MQAEEKNVRLLTEGQLRDSLVPALDDTSDTDLGDKRVSSVSGRVELVAVEEGPDVVDGDGVSGLGEGLSAEDGKEMG